MSFLSSFYPQPVVAGTTEGTFAEGDDPRILGAIQSGGSAGGGLSGTYPNPTLAPIVSTGSITGRSVQERFAERVNVKDFGAVGDGIADDWLAIQRALAHAGGGLDAATLTMPAALGVSDPMSIQAFGVWIPKLLYFATSQKTVYFPSGTYAISRPLVTSGESFHLLGQGGGGRVSRIIVSKEAATSAGLSTMFNAIEPLGEWVYREITAVSGVEPTFWGLWPDYGHNSCIENITVQLGERDGNNNTIARPFSNVTDDLSYVPFTENAPPFLKVSGVSGTNTITLNNSQARLWVGMKIKPREHATTYTVSSFTQGGGLTTVTTIEEVTETFTNLMALRGKPAANGIVMNGGENMSIIRCYANNFYYGSGFVLLGGSPAAIINNCMSNLNKVGYEINSGASVLIKPSGDNNHTFIRAGFLSLATIVVQSMKVENFGSPPFFGFETGNKELFQLGSYGAQGRPSSMVFIGGSVNINVSSNLEDSVIYSEYSTVYPANIQSLGVAILDNCSTIYQRKNLTNNNIVKRIGRGDWQGSQHSERYGGKAEYMPDALVDWRVGGDRRNVVFDIIDGRGGIYADAGSGRPIGTATIKSRVGQTVTFTQANHGLQVGNQIFIAQYIETTPSNTFFTLTGNGADNSFTGSLFVKSVNGNDFTCTVADSGPTSGTVKLIYGKYWEFHGYYNGRHIVQMPNDGASAGPNGEMFVFKDLQNRNLSGLRVATANEGDWWASKSLNIGGTIDSPASRILHGTGVPSLSAPNGSLYLRTDGDASTTLYVRAGGTWKPLSSYEA